MNEIWEISFFEDEKGNVPVRDYLMTLKTGEQKRFLTRLIPLQEKGLAAGRPYSDKLEDNLYELRLENSPHNPRFLYCTAIGRVLHLLHGFSKTGKNSDLVPESEKIIARRRRDQLFKRLQAQQAAMEQPQKQAKKER